MDGSYTRDGAQFSGRLLVELFDVISADSSTVARAARLLTFARDGNPETKR
jgi:hypothetical protein